MFFNRAVTIFPGLQTILLVVLWIVLPLMWIGGSLYALAKWPKTVYTLTNNALRIRKNGWFGAYSEQLYRYDNILAVESSRSAWGAYGNVTIALSRLEPIVIRAAQNPAEQARKIKELVAKGQPKIQTIPQ